MIFCIPTYRRSSKIKTVDYLHSCGVSKSDIIVSTQDVYDYQEYKFLEDKCRLIYEEGHNVAQNRNTALRYARSLGESRILMLDDDISALKILHKEGDRKTAIVEVLKENLMQYINWFFDAAEKHGCVIWGGAAIDNPFFMRKTATKNTLLIGCIMGIMDNSLYFNNDYALKEDYELCLRAITQGKNVLKFNYLCPAAEHRSLGGYHEHWIRQESSQYSDRLVFGYPNLVTKKKNGELKIKSNGVLR